MADTEDLEALLAAHVPAADWHCSCGYDVFGGSAAYSQKLGDAHMVSVMASWLLARDERIRADEREAWASWLETWLSAVGPEPPTAEAVVRWLRADTRPFGCYANTELAGEVEAQ